MVGAFLARRTGEIFCVFLGEQRRKRGERDARGSCKGRSQGQHLGRRDIFWGRYFRAKVYIKGILLKISSAKNIASCWVLPLGLRWCAVLHCESPEISFANYYKAMKRKQGERNQYNFEAFEFHYFCRLWKWLFKSACAHTFRLLCPERFFTCGFLVNMFRMQSVYCFPLVSTNFFCNLLKCIYFCIKNALHVSSELKGRYLYQYICTYVTVEFYLQ